MVMEEQNATSAHEAVSASIVTAQTSDIERERLISLINSMADGVIATDEYGKIVLYNGAALNVLDVNVELHNKKLDDVAKVVDILGDQIDITQLILDTTTQLISRDHRIMYSDGSYSNLYISISPVRSDYSQSQNMGYVIILRDITREKSLEEERDEFISVISHELRTPIAISEGNLSNAKYVLEKTGQLNETTRNALDQAHDQILYLASMMNDLATLSRAERGTLTLDVEAINTSELIDSLVKQYEPSAAQKNLELHGHAAPDLELLYSSKLYLKEILQNFITNAIKYTETGSVTITAQRKDNGVLFEVIDTGIGISKKDQEKVFLKFFRSEDYRTRANSGTGLGLYVTMKLVKILQANISVTSELNKGSTFSIYTPNLEPTKLQDIDK
jgi:two-component system, OmpR family, phosphate regulon sensor histidine kinase PhoR